jgi:hypothetical protein
LNYDRCLEEIQLRNVRLELYTEQVLRRSEEGELFSPTSALKVR